MQQSPLLASFRAAGHALAAYRGSLTGYDGMPPLTVPLATPRLWDASWRAVIRADGPEARKWLNGMISAHVNALAPGQWAPSFQLDPKGHILALLDVACVGEQSFLLLCDEEARAGLLSRLQRFLFVSKLTLTDESEVWSALRVWGEGAGSACSAAGLGPVPGPGEVVQRADGYRLGLSHGLEVWAKPGDISAYWAKLSAFASIGDAGEQERQRILGGEPRYGFDITEGELPQETGEMARLDFNKGCYVGQEIVERIRARGAVHRHLRTLRFDAAVEPGSALTAAGASIGRLTSVAPRDGAWLALGYVRDPHAEAGARLEAEGVPGTVLA